MQNNVNDNSNKFCSGCSACYSVCPKKAIEIKIDEDGFFRAFIDKEKCINCGKCKKVCTRYSDKEENNPKELEKGKLYSAQSKEKEVINTCTSGGIAYEIARYGIKNGYKIAGVIYNYQQNIAETIITNNLEELEKIKGSKYIQANPTKAFEEIVNECKKDKDAKYIVFGTPCQIAGLRKLINVFNIQNDIIMVDLFCHGVPSYLVWNQYIKWLKEKEKIEKIDKVVFRSKHIGWHDYCMEVHSEKKKYYKCAEGNTFYKVFFDDILLNKSCFNCEYRMNSSHADIRLGDYWGKRYKNRQDGVSAILVLTDSGESIIKNIIKNNQITILEENEPQDCLKYQSGKTYDNMKIREEAFEILKKTKNLQKTIKHYRKLMPMKWKIKKTIKESTIILPDKVRAKMKKILK